MNASYKQGTSGVQLKLTETATTNGENGGTARRAAPCSPLPLPPHRSPAPIPGPKRSAISAMTLTIDRVGFSCLLLKRRGLATSSHFWGTGCCTICPGVVPCRQPTTFQIAATQSDLHLYVLIINSGSRHDLLSRISPIQ